MPFKKPLTYRERVIRLYKAVTKSKTERGHVAWWQKQTGYKALSTVSKQLSGEAKPAPAALALLQQMEFVQGLISSL